MALNIQELLEKVTVDEINREFRNGKITAEDRDEMLKAKASLRVEKVKEKDSSFVRLVMEKTVENVEKGWANIKEAAQHEQFPHGTESTSQQIMTEPLQPVKDFGKNVGREIYYAMLAMWGQIQILTSVIDAVGEVGGEQLKLGLIENGASPTVASVISALYNVGVGAVPVGGAIKSGVKGIQNIAAKAGKGAKAGTDEELAERAIAIIADGMKADGADANIIDKAVASTNIGVDKAKSAIEKIEGLGKETPTQIQKALEGVARLPPTLQGAKPRYNMGRNEFIPEFASDTDKALFIVAQEKRSLKDEKYMGWLREQFPGYSDATIRDMGRQIRSEIKELAKKSEAGFGTLLVPSSKAKETVKPLTTRTFAETAEELGKISEEDARKQLPSLMKKFGVSWSDVRSMKEAGVPRMTAQQFYGQLKALELHAEDLSVLAQKATVEGAKIEDQIKFAQAATSLVTGVSPTGDRISHGKAFTDLLVHWDSENVAKGDMVAAMRTFAQDIATISQREPARFASGLFKSQEGFALSGVLTKGTVEIFRNMLLPLSWAPTAVGNSIAMGMAVAERTAGSMLGAAGTGYSIKEPFYLTKGMMLAFGDGMRSFGRTFGTTPGTIPGRAGQLVRLPTDSVVAMDNWAKMMLYRGELYAQGIREAERLGVPQKHVGKFVEDFVRTPPTEVLEQAYKFAWDNTYQGALTRLGEKFAELAQHGPGTLWFTFVRSPMNLAHYAWDRTPGIQLLSKRLYADMAEGGVKAEAAMARLFMGNMMGMFFYEMAKEGIITGSGPMDPRYRDAWLAANEPYSFKTDDGFWSYKQYEPLSQILGFVTDLAQIADQLDKPTFDQAIAAIGYSLVHNIADRTSWQTLSNGVDVIQSLSRGQGLTRRDINTALAPFASIVTGGPLVNRAAKAMDPVMRDTRTFMDSIASRIPIWGSPTVAPRHDGYGDILSPPQPIGNSWFGMLGPLAPRFKPKTDDPVKIEGDRVKARLPKFDEYIGSNIQPQGPLDLVDPLPTDIQAVALTNAQREKRREIYRHNLRVNPKTRIDTNLLETERYNNANDAEKGQLFTDYVTDIKKLAEDSLMIADPTLGRQVIQNQWNAVKPFLQEPQATQQQQKFDSGLMLYENMTERERANMTRWGILPEGQK